MGGHGRSANGATPRFVASKLPLQTQCLLFLLAQFALGSTDLQLSISITLLKFIDALEETRNLLLGLVHVVAKLNIDLLTSINLGLEILDSTVNVPQRALLGTILVLLVFQVGLKLKKES